MGVYLILFQSYKGWQNVATPKAFFDTLSLDLLSKRAFTGRRRAVSPQGTS